MNKKLYVGNLNYEVTEDDLRDLFQAHGEVEDAKIITDRDTGRPRGFGFVTMGSSDAASKAIDALHGHPFKGRNLTVNLAREEQRNGGGGGGGGGGNRGSFRR